MSSLERRRRVRCRLACELLGARRTRSRSSIVTLSEGGFALETEPRFEMGEEVRVCILPHRRERAVKITGIIWNDQPSRRRGSPLHVFGCVVSDPPPRFLELLAEVEAREVTSEPRPSFGRSRAETRRPSPRRRPAPEPPVGAAELPRSREPMPPPKPEPEETLPRFRVRLKQVGGARTRTVELRAPSAARARDLALGEVTGAGTRWQVLEVAPADPHARRRGP